MSTLNSKWPGKCDFKFAANGHNSNLRTKTISSRSAWYKASSSKKCWAPLLYLETLYSRFNKKSSIVRLQGRLYSTLQSTWVEVADHSHVDKRTIKLLMLRKPHNMYNQAPFTNSVIKKSAIFYPPPAAIIPSPSKKWRHLGLTPKSTQYSQYVAVGGQKVNSDFSDLGYYHLKNSLKSIDAAYSYW